MTLNATNDAFFIWHSSKFATINGFRLGRLPSVQVDWLEINAALGHAALLLTTISRNPRVDLRFTTYKILPAGSFTKIAKLDGNNIVATYPLYTDGSYALFGKRNFNSALKGLLHCLADGSQYVAAQNRTMQFPYPIERAGDSNNKSTTSSLIGTTSSIGGGGTMTIGGLSFAVGCDEEIWTRAMKYFLVDLKWLVAFCAKQVDG
jgi:beclin 1